MKSLKVNQERITGRDTTSFKLYLQEIAQIDRLTVDEEYELTLKVEKGCKIALDELVRRNLRFVVSVAKQYVTSDNHLEDLVNEGNVGLMKAAKKFEPTRGFKFITFAVWWIRKEITSFTSENQRIIRLPYNKLALVNKMRTDIARLEQRLERQASREEIIDFLEGPIEQRTKDVDFYIRHHQGGAFSLDKPFDDDDSNTIMSDCIADDTFGGADHLVATTTEDAKVNKILAVLKTDKERQIIIMLFGLDGQPERSLIEVGKEFDVSRERIRQIKDKALKLMKANYKKTL